jgi:hypothetical protein
MNNLARLAYLVLAVTLSAATFACGICIEDKIAATYDHAVVMRAAARHHVLVFGEIVGTAAMQGATKKIARAAPQVQGIDRASVRTSVSPPAFSFALDPAVQAPDAAVAELQKSVPVAKLKVLRVMPADAKTARQQPN